MQSYSDANKQRITDLNAKIREMIQETAEILVKEENISRAEAEASIGFHYEATSMVLIKRKSPYNVFTERLAAEKKAEPHSGDQPRGSFQREASQLYQALGPEDKADLVKSVRIDSNLSETSKHSRHARAVKNFKNHLTAYNTICGSNFLLLSVYQNLLPLEDGSVAPVVDLFSAGAHCDALKLELGGLIQNNMLERLEAEKKCPCKENTKAFPYKKLCDGTADVVMRGWPQGIPIKHASKQSNSCMRSVLRAINGNKISFVFPEETMEQ
ncbi:hypothetical protein INT47_011575 [Mucor saturninus]|uniref:Uncharacterized protein n=1 Tax=Mucor saturninus TaxID=64648 RepID=A0A8H7V132_9FUNG|nr:hypothetical protein INT47_011575 [Mucor saturninus]